MAERGQVVYVVDDDHANARRDSRKGGLPGKGCLLPEEAPNAAPGLRPDLLITDVVMLGMTGIEINYNQDPHMPSRP